MPFALRKRSVALRALALATCFGAGASALSAAPFADHVAASRTETGSDQIIRVLLGRAASGEAVGRSAAGLALWKGRTFRGAVELVPDGIGLAVINRVDLEDYLRGVLPEEIGSRDPRDRAALQAQAVAARSYAAARMGDRRPLYDVTATVSDQVYGGQSVERPATDDAVRDTRGLVLTWNDRIITAPYHSHGGEVTAAPVEIWKRASEPYLQPVSDRTAGGGCFCDVSGNHGWVRRFSFAEVESLLQRYGPEAGVALAGEVRAVRVSSRGPSGRVTALEIETAAGRVIVRGNDIRSVLRRDGAILPSTSFQLEMVGPLVLLRGVGNGHGVGMSQWGAIGRSRAGQDARTILAAYYPGTRLAPLL